MKKIVSTVRTFLSDQFDLQKGRADAAVIIENIRNNVEFTGVNLWALIFAIIIASIGLNVNSTAVIIGAMLISPIMGPVMGIGLGIGINDLPLVKKGAKNLFVATIIGILASTIYFLITPLHDAQSELLARTSPSIWDVFIAFFGGAAGMAAASRMEKSNVIPGVAIATALMPPLCTAGFGIATNNWAYFFGAIYLYFINSVFIAIATYLMSRYLKMHREHLEDAANQKKASRVIIIVVVVTVIPSVIMAYRIVEKSIFENNAQRFIDEQFKYPNTQVVSKSYHYKGKDKFIEVLLIGVQLNKKTTDSLSANLVRYKLDGVHLIVKQGLNAINRGNLSQIKESILEDVLNKIPKPGTARLTHVKVTNQDEEVLSELRVLYPAIISFGTSKMSINKMDSLKTDSIEIAMIKFKPRIRKADQVKLENWLRARYKSNSLRLVVE